MVPVHALSGLFYRVILPSLYAPIALHAYLSSLSPLSRIDHPGGRPPGGRPEQAEEQEEAGTLAAGHWRQSPPQAVADGPTDRLKGLHTGGRGERSVVVYMGVWKSLLDPVETLE